MFSSAAIRHGKPRNTGYRKISMQLLTFTFWAEFDDNIVIKSCTAPNGMLCCTVLVGSQAGQDQETKCICHGCSDIQQRHRE
jgi:hypothetical protein